MTGIRPPELMELDSYWENAMKDATENTVHSKRRLNVALQNRKKINKILQKFSYKPLLMEIMRKGQMYSGSEGDGMDEENDEISSISSCENNLRRESSVESINEVEQRDKDKTKSGPSAKRKTKSAPAKRGYYKEKSRMYFRDKEGKKIKRTNAEFVREQSEGERGDVKKKGCLPRHCSKINPYVLRKKKMAVITAEIKRKRRNANAKRQEKRTKNVKVRGKIYKTKRQRKKLESDDDDKNDEKQDQKSKNQETKVENSNTKEGTGNVNNEDIKKSSVEGKEMPVAKKDSPSSGKNTGNLTNPPKTEKGDSKGDCGQDRNPKENDISKCGDMNKKMAMACGLRGPPGLYSIKRSNRNCMGSRKRKNKRKRRGKKRIGPFIKFYLTVFKELCGTCSIRSIAREAGKRWRCMSCKEKLKYYPKNYK